VISLCEAKQVELVDQNGYRIHLWRIRHGIRTICDRESSDLESDDDVWYATSDDTGGLSPDPCVGDTISSDEDDSPYQYVSRPDLEKVEPDSEEEDW